METNDSFQLLLVVETSEEDKSDAIYINEVLKKYFDTSKTNIHWITLCGKTNYKDKKILSKIKNLTKMFGTFTGGSTETIYFIDTDSTEEKYRQGSFFYNLCEFIKENNFNLVWFCKNAENVFLKVEPNEKMNKTDAAKEFSVLNKIDEIDVKMLSKANIELNCSNIILIMSKYLKRK